MDLNLDPFMEFTQNLGFLEYFQYRFFTHTHTLSHSLVPNWRNVSHPSGFDPLHEQYLIAALTVVVQIIILTS